MSEFSLDNVNSMYMDVLKEIGNIGAGNATTAIAGMLGTTMKMEVPRVLLMDATKLGDAICPEEETIVGIFLEVTNDISGSMMFLMKLPAAHFLVNKLMGRPQDYNEPFDEMDLSAMKELATNVLAYSVTFEDNGTYDSTREKNLTLNGIAYKVLKILESNGDSISTGFHIVLDESGNYAFDVDEGFTLNRFRADIYGEPLIDNLTKKQKKATADQMIEFMSGKQGSPQTSYL